MSSLSFDADSGERIRKNMWSDPHVAFYAGDQYVAEHPARDFVVLNQAGDAVPRSALRLRSVA